MNAVEIADRHHGAVQRTDIEGFGALCAFATMWKALDLLIFAPWRPFAPDTVSAW